MSQQQQAGGDTKETLIQVFEALKKSRFLDDRELSFWVSIIEGDETTAESAVTRLVALLRQMLNRIQDIQLDALNKIQALERAHTDG